MVFRLLSFPDSRDSSGRLIPDNIRTGIQNHSETDAAPLVLRWITWAAGPWRRDDAPEASHFRVPVQLMVTLLEPDCSVSVWPVVRVLPLYGLRDDAPEVSISVMPAAPLK